MRVTGRRTDECRRLGSYQAGGRKWAATVLLRPNRWKSCGGGRTEDFGGFVETSPLVRVGLKYVKVDVDRMRGLPGGRKLIP